MSLFKIVISTGGEPSTTESVSSKCNANLSMDMLVKQQEAHGYEVISSTPIITTMEHFDDAFFVDSTATIIEWKE